MKDGSPRLRRRMTALAVFALSVPTALHAAQQAPPSGSSVAATRPAPPTGTGRLTVRVVSADNGAAVKRARVMVTGLMIPPQTQRQAAPAGPAVTSSVSVESSAPNAGGVIVSGGTTSIVSGGATGSVVSGQVPGDPGNRTVRHECETDPSGTCTFTELPAAMYTVMVTAPGGFARSSIAPSVRLADGGSETLTVRMARAGAIEGRVTDDAGDPVVRAQVRALRREPSAGRRLMMGGTAMTDDRGQFRLFELQPGEYLVSAEVTSPMGPDTGGVRVGLAPTYYPGSPAIDGARSVTVRSGQDATGIEFALVRAPMGTISGAAFDSEGKPLAGPGGGVSLQLVPRGEFYGGGRGAMVQPDGRFVIRNVAPGDYYLSAILFRGQGREANGEGAFVPITVNGDEVSVDLRTNTGATVAGRVLFEGEPPARQAPTVTLNGASAGRAVVSARPPNNGSQPPGSSFGTGPVGLRDDDRFELTRLRGTVMLNVRAPGAAVRAILRGGRDITSEPLELTGTERIDDIEILVTYDTGSLEGLVAGASADTPAATRAYAVVFPDDPARWFDGSPFVTPASVVTEATLRLSSRPPTSGLTTLPRPLTPGEEARRWTPVPGGFFVSQLLPGRYLVAAVEVTGGTPLTFDRESLQQLKERAVAVTLRVGEKSKVQVPAPPAPR